MAKIYGTNGNDNLNGTGKNDKIYSYGGNDIITPGLGDDLIYSESGGKTLIFHKGDGNDTLLVNTDVTYFSKIIDQELLNGGIVRKVINNNTITESFKSSYGDSITVLTFGRGQYSTATNPYGVGDDELQGGASNDTFYSKGGNDTITSGDGSDILYGEDGKDYLAGGDGNDVINGGNGNDKIIGGFDAGQVTIKGGKATLVGGGDTLTGGAGADLFKYSKSGTKDEGADIITDFQDNIDKLQLKGIFTLIDVVNGTFIDYGNNHGVIVENISKGNLADDIITLA